MKRYFPQPLLAITITILAILNFAFGSGPAIHAQTAVSGAVAGTVTDSTGALIPGAKVTIESTGTGAIQTTTAGAGGEFRFSLLAPGKYKLNASAAGFESTQTQVMVNVGTVAAANLKLSVGVSTQTVQVTESVPMLQTETADISTTYTTDQIQNLPNPGNDITYMGQLAPGSVINSTNQAANGMFGYGNFSSFGLPATSNNFTVNGTDENDPFFNVNNSGATNLLLGNNEIAETTVTSNAYTAQFGGLGGAQLNEVTRSGTNRYHGNVVYWWDGRAMNANSYFNNQQGVPRPFVNDNQWAAAIGGPIKTDRLFFFLDTEGIRFIFPTSTQVFIPSASYEASVLASVAANNPSETSFYKNLFSLYNGAPGAAGATPYVEEAGADPDVNTFRSTASSGANEWLLTGRLDYTIGTNDKLFGRYKMDRGYQPSYTDPINSLFDLVSSQPSYESQLVETHSFSGSIVNQFLIYGAYYSAIFAPANLATTESTFDGTFVFEDAPNPATGLTDIFNTLSPYGYFSNGRKATQYGVEDDLNYARGTQTFRAGWSFKRNDISDFDLREESYPLNIAYGPNQAAAAGAAGTNFNNGYAIVTEQDFPLHQSDPVALYQMGGYVEDDWNATPAFKLNLGLRLEHNSNPVCVSDCFARLDGDFYTLASSAASGNGLTIPYNQLINPSQRRTFHGYEHIAIEPRIGFTYSPGRNGTDVIRAGFGIFADVFPGTVADSELFDPPNDLGFVVSGGLLDPSLPNSGSGIAASNAKAFRNGFASGASASGLMAANPSFTPPNFTTATQQIQYPTYEEWSLQVQHQFGRDTALTLGYVGNHGYHEPAQENSVNGFNNPATSGIAFNGLPLAAPLPAFGPVNLIESSASSSYNGATVTLRHREKFADVTVNYTYSHALDEISNGGFLPFNPGNSSYPEDPFNMKYNYGNADYDVRHNLTGNYVISPPAWHSLRTLTGSWQLSGTVFYHSGFPYSVTDDNTSSALSTENYQATLFADQLGAQSTNHCSTAAVYNFASGTGAPCLKAAGFGSATGFGQGSRNSFFGTQYFDTDFAVQKGFLVPRHDSAKFTVGAQFFNALNHPNFGNPVGNIDSPLFGLIDGTVSPPTSIFGFALGGDASSRVIQLKGTFQF